MIKFYEKIFTIETINEFSASKAPSFARLNSVTLKYDDIPVATLRYYYSCEMQKSNPTPTMYVLTDNINDLIDEHFIGDDFGQDIFLHEIDEYIDIIIRTYSKDGNIERREL